METIPLIQDSDSEQSPPARPHFHRADTTLLPESEKLPLRRPAFHRRDSSDATLVGTDDATVENQQKQVPINSFSHDLILLCCIVTMLLWPWIFFSIVKAKDGFEYPDSVAKVMKANQQYINYFVTLFATLASLGLGILFSIAMVRFAQEWVASKNGESITPFQVTLLYAFRHRVWPWKAANLNQLGSKQRWMLAMLVVVCMIAFTFVPSSTSTLIGPVAFNRTGELSGSELDMGPAASDCMNWFDSRTLANVCDWQEYKGVWYTSCLGQNQFVDVLESGRGNILSLIQNNTDALVLSQLSAQGLHILGPIRGVLPIGPNGAPAFDTTIFALRPQKRLGLTYNYTLDNQGIYSDIKCVYDDQSPVTPSAFPGNTAMIQYNGTCPDGTTDFFPEMRTKFLFSPRANSTLLSWACETPASSTEGPTYNIYIRGYGERTGGYYRESIGNITCTVAPIRPAVFPVLYDSQRKAFTVHTPRVLSTTFSSKVLRRAMLLFSDTVRDSQSSQANVVAESVMTFGVKSFTLKPHVQDPEYLRLYERMVQGIFEYGLTYLRIIYSTDDSAPASCRRPINGTYSYEVYGWEVIPQTPAFLMPMTIVNLAALVVTSIAMWMARSGRRTHNFDPTDPIMLITAQHTPDPNSAHEWSGTVSYKKEIYAPVDAAKIAKEEAEDAVKDVIGATADILTTLATP